MAHQQGTRTIQCLHCRYRFEVSVDALSVPCPKCYKTSAVEDYVLKKTKPKLLMLTSVRTCGRIVVPKGARIVSDLVEAHGGIEVRGYLEAKRVLSGAPVLVGKKGVWKGNLQAPSLIVEDHAVIERGYFQIPSDPLGLATLPRPLAEPKARRKFRRKAKSKPEPEPRLKVKRIAKVDPTRKTKPGVRKKVARRTKKKPR